MLRNSILFVDDDPLYVDIVTQGLRFAFPEMLIYGAKNGAEALQILASREVSLVITDLCMPEVDGFEILLALKDREPAIPTIAVSGFGFANPSDLARDFGTSMLLEKPVDFETLCHVVRGILDRERKNETVVDGFSLTSFLQIMEMDRKTGTLHVFADAHDGTLCFEEGTLTYAVAEGKEGNAAVFAILGWHAPKIRISGESGGYPPNISESLSALLLEGCHVLDETNGCGVA